MKFDIPALTLLYLVVFLAMNAVFAGLWYIEQDKCCDDPTMTYAQVFDFAIQTSSTIGYGGYWPKGYFNNAMVVLLSVLSILLSTVYAGMLFFKFITPECNIEFSNIITMSNVMGTPCLEIRVGNVDGRANKLINAEANLCVESLQKYRCQDENRVQTVTQQEELQLAVSSQHMLYGVWTLRHYINEDSPLYGLRLDEFPGSTIFAFRLNIKAIQALTKGEVYAQTSYEVCDVLVGHRFEDQVDYNENTRKLVFDYAKMNNTYPFFVWYPEEANILKDE